MTLTAELQLTYGRVALIDSSDLVLTSGTKWFVSKFGYVVSAKRMLLNGKKTQAYLARYLLGHTCFGLTVDHINGDKLDNRRCNLRVATVQQNTQNSRHGRLKGIQQITWTKSPRWTARIGWNSKTRYIGIYKSELDALQAYNKAAQLLFGEFACPNEV